MDKVSPIDPWAAPSTRVFALIGLLFISVKIFSFWRLIASLFILPGISACFSHSLRIICVLTCDSYPNSARKEHGPL